MNEQDIRDAFDFFDIDHDGRITESELHSVLTFFGNFVTKEEVHQMITDADTDGNGTVEYHEFRRMMDRYAIQNPSQWGNGAMAHEMEVWELFRVFDHNGDCLIDFEEIKRTMHRLGERVSDDDVRAMMLMADTNKDGVINYEEFKHMMQMMRENQGQAVTR